MPVTYTPLTDTLGAQVSGVAIAAGVTDQDVLEILRLFNEHSVLVFHDQDMTDAQQIRFSQRFAELGGFPRCVRCWSDS